MNKIPPKAKDEAREKLLSSMEVYADDLEEILERYHVREDPEKLQRRFQRRYQQTVGQRYMASFRDENGDRAVLAVRDKNGRIKYTIVDACNDLVELQAARIRVYEQAGGLKKTSLKVRNRIKELERILRSIWEKEAS